MYIDISVRTIPFHSIPLHYITLHCMHTYIHMITYMCIYIYVYIYIIIERERERVVYLQVCSASVDLRKENGGLGEGAAPPP